MKYLLFALLTFSFLACGNTGAQPAATTAQPAAQAPATERVPAPLPASPCDSYTPELIAETFGWERSMDGQPAAMFDGRMQGCTFTPGGSVGGDFVVTVTQSDARTIEMKYLEKAFSRDLSDNDRLTSVETTPTLGDQTVFSHGKRGPAYLYQLRWREGNELDYVLTFRSRKQKDKADMETKLRVLAARL